MPLICEIFMFICHLTIPAVTQVRHKGYKAFAEYLLHSHTENMSWPLCVAATQYILFLCLAFCSLCCVHKVLSRA